MDRRQKSLLEIARADLADAETKLEKISNRIAGIEPVLKALRDNHADLMAYCDRRRAGIRELEEAQDGKD